jgi:succinate dehydrogenase / fumarate reductase cytochrome b subunit
MRRYLGLMFTYRGREGTWAWAFHRLSGVGVWLFVVLHVIDIYLVGGNPDAYNEILRFYASPIGRLMEVVLGAALLYHALNGLRIIIIDLWPAMTVHHRALWWASWTIFVLVGIPGAVIILRPLWKDVVDGAAATLHAAGLM